MRSRIIAIDSMMSLVELRAFFVDDVLFLGDAVLEFKSSLFITCS